MGGEPVKGETLRPGGVSPFLDPSACRSSSRGFASSAKMTEQVRPPPECRKIGLATVSSKDRQMVGDGHSEQVLTFCCG